MKNIGLLSKDKKRVITYIVTVILSVIFLFAGNMAAHRGYNSASEGTAPALSAVVTEKHRSQYDEEQGTTNIEFLARITSGENKGKSVTVLQSIDASYAFSAKEVEIGDKVLIYENAIELYTDDSYDSVVYPVDTNAPEYAFSEYVRTDHLVWLLIAFFVCLLIFGGSKGFNTIVSLGFTVLSIIVVFLPACLSGQNIYVWTTVICTFIIIMTLLIIYGIKKQSIAAGISCFAGMAVCGALTVFMSNIMKLTGLTDENSYFLTQLQTAKPINLNAITFAAITIGAIGAVMDVSISISSSLQEVDAKAPHLTRMQLLGSGMTIGRDMMGTMANTLVLAYIGSSLAVTLILMAYQTSVIELFNKELIVTELLQILVGSFGILMTIPLTSLICSFLYKLKDKKKEPLTAE